MVLFAARARHACEHPCSPQPLRKAYAFAVQVAQPRFERMLDRVVLDDEVGLLANGDCGAVSVRAGEPAGGLLPGAIRGSVTVVSASGGTRTDISPCDIVGP
jgi:hypothetical protein